MTGNGLIHIDTPEALERFRKEHYLFVYSTALELTNSPNEAHRIAAQVFTNIGEHSHNRTLSKNCDMFLAAQVNLVFAQLNSHTQKSQAQAARQLLADGSVDESRRRVAQNRSTLVDGTRLPTQNSSSISQAITRQQPAPAAPTEITQPVYAQTVQPAGKAVVTVPPQQNAANIIQETPRVEEKTVIQGQSNPVTAAVQPVAVPGMAPPQTTVTIQFSGPSPSMESVTVSSDTAKEPVQQFIPATYSQQVNQGAGKLKSKDTTIDKVDYNPAETDMWTPDMDKDGKQTDTAGEVENASEKRTSRWDDYIEAPNSQWKQKNSGKPILLFTLLNGILMIAAIVTVAYTLYRFGLLPKLF